MRIAVCSDHGGYILKERVKEWLIKEGHEVNDFGTFNEESCDYPDFAKVAAVSVAEGACGYGFLFCTTGTGMAICANKVKGVRCALPVSVRLAELAREHNDANMCAFGSSVIGFAETKEIISAFINTSFGGGRHGRRVNKINDLDSLK